VPSEGNPRLVLRLDPLIRSGLEARAMSRGVSLSELARYVLVEYVKQSAEAKEGTPALLRHLDTLVRTLQLQATALTLPALQAPGRTKQAFGDQFITAAELMLLQKAEYRRPGDVPSRPQPKGRCTLTERVRQRMFEGERWSI